MNNSNETPPAAGSRRPDECPDFAAIVRESSIDSSLFEQIATCFSQQLEDYARYVCRDRTQGQDAFQDAMVAAMRHLDTYRGDSPIEAWLKRIVVTACSRLRRGMKNDPSVNLPLDEVEDGRAVADETPGEDLRLMIAQRLEMLRAEIDRLEEPNRSLLQQHDLHEVPIAELAERHDLTPEAVKSRLKRARSVVREKLLRRIGA